MWEVRLRRRRLAVCNESAVAKGRIMVATAKTWDIGRERIRIWDQEYLKKSVGGNTKVHALHCDVWTVVQLSYKAGNPE